MTVRKYKKYKSETGEGRVPFFVLRKIREKEGRSMLIKLVEIWDVTVPAQPARVWDGKEIPARPERVAHMAFATDGQGTQVLVDLDTGRAPGTLKVGTVLDVQAKDWPEAAIRAILTGRPISRAAEQSFDFVEGLKQPKAGQ